MWSDVLWTFCWCRITIYEITICSDVIVSMWCLCCTRSFFPFSESKCVFSYLSFFTPADLSMHTVHNTKECERVMELGWKNRSVGATLMNADSSRSHSIFTIHIEMCDLDENGQDHIRAGKLNLVDLAGSERQTKTGLLQFFVTTNKTTCPVFFHFPQRRN